jgi:hypothetical protein
MSWRAAPGSGWIVILLLGGLLSASCSGRAKVHPVHGRVLVNGQPAAGARVVFHPRDNSDPHRPLPTGIVAEDGSFAVTSYQQGDGAAEGDYTVTVVWPNQSSRKVLGGGVDQDRLGGAYSDPARSQLQVRVTAGRNDLEPFNLH